MSVLYTLEREGLPEVTVRGAFAWGSLEQDLGGSNPERVVFVRSLIKPLAAKATASSLADLSDAELAIVCASHNGTAEHVLTARSVAGAGAGALRTPASQPLGSPSLRRPNPWRHPCSGEHAGILHACRAAGWDPATYLAEDHPRQVAVRSWLARVLGPAEAAHVAVDGCGLPTEARSLSELARCYAAVAAWRQEDRVWAAMTAHPERVGGTGRIDTALLVAGAGRLVAKEGADGLLAVAVAQSARPQALGLVVKIDHGWDGTAAGRVAAALLATVGVEVPSAPAPKGQVLRWGAAIRGPATS